MRALMFRSGRVGGTSRGPDGRRSFCILLERGVEQGDFVNFCDKMSYFNNSFYAAPNFPAASSNIAFFW